MTLRVLVIEDDPNVSEVVARYLAREGYPVETAADGAAGLARLREKIEADPSSAHYVCTEWGVGYRFEP